MLFKKNPFQGWEDKFVLLVLMKVFGKRTTDREMLLQEF